MLRRTAVLAYFTCLVSAGALAQTAPAGSPVRLRGTAAAVSADSLTVATRDGPQVVVKLNQPLTVAALKAVPVADIKPGSFLAIVSKPGTDDLQAKSVIYFPPGVTGPHEGQFPWDLPNTTMTNAIVSGAVTSSSGREIGLSFNGRSGKVNIPAGTPVVTQIPAAVSDLKPGVPVMIFATKAPDGVVSTARVTIGKDGVNPAS